MKRKPVPLESIRASDRRIPVVKPPEELMRDLVHAARVAFMPDSLIKEGSKQFWLQISHFRKAITLPAAILAMRGAALPWDRYQELVMKVIMDAKVHASPDLRFPGGYLRKVMQTYMAHHWEEWYWTAKGIRTQLDRELAKTGEMPMRDLTTEILAQANALISTKRKPKPTSTPVPTVRSASAETQMGLF
jgi:hypothetical protein